MADNEVRLRVTSDTSAAVAGMDQVRGSMKGMEAESATMIGKIKQHWLGYSAAIASASLAANKAFSMMQEGAKATQAEEAFRNAADSIGENADSIVEDLKRVTNATVDDSDMMQKAFKAISGGMNKDDIVNIGQIARLEARRTGEDVGVTFSNIVDAIETGKTKALRSYHLITADQKKIADGAKEVGIEVDLMRIVMMNYLIQAEHAGKITETTTERFQQMKAASKELGEGIGNFLIGALSMTAGAMMNLAAKILYPLMLIEKGINMIPGVKQAGLANNTWEDWYKKAKDMEARLFGEGGTGESKPPVAGAADKARADMKKYFDDLKKQTDALKGAKGGNIMDELAVARLEWKKAIDAMNPSLDQEGKQLEQLIERAGILRTKWGQKGADTSWIDDELKRGKEYIALAREMREIEEMSKITADRLQKELDLKLMLIDADTQRNILALEYSRRALDIGVRYGNVTQGQAAGASFDMDVRRLEITKQSLDLQIQAHSELSLEEQENTGILKLLLQQKAVQEEINLLLNLRSSVLKEHEGTYAEGMATGWKKYMDSIGSEFQRGEQMSQDLAKTMHGALEEFFFDPAKFSWDNLWNSLRRIAAKAMADMVMDWMKSLGKMQSGGESCFSGLFAPFKSLFGFGGGAGGVDWSGIELPAEGYHTGGPVRRMHRGGLMSDEVPAILQTGEYVMSRKQVAAMKSGGGSSGPTVNNVTINATDAQSFTNMLRANPNAIADAFISAGRSNHPARRRR